MKAATMFGPIFALLASAAPSPSVVAPVPAAAPFAGAPLPSPLPFVVDPKRFAAFPRILVHHGGSLVREEPGLASHQIAIGSAGKIVYDRGFGKASRTTSLPIGAATELFTTVAVMQLVERHEIDLDAKLETYLPGFPHARDLTTRQLLLGNVGLDARDASRTPERVRRRTTPIASLAMLGRGPLEPPSTASAEHDTADFVILALLVERVTGKPLSSYEREHLFAPAGLVATRRAAFVPTLLGPASVVARADPSWYYGAADLSSTAADLARFDEALLAGRLVAPATLAAMVRGRLGLSIVTLRGDFVADAAPAFVASNLIDLTRGVSIVTLVDDPERPPVLIGGELFRAVVPPRTIDRAPVATLVMKAVSDLEAGTPQPEMYAEPLRETLRPATIAATSAAFKALGTIEAATVDEPSSLGPSLLYRVHLRFSSGKERAGDLALDIDGKIVLLTLDLPAP